MDPAEPKQPAQAPAPAQAAQDGTAAATGPAAEPIAGAAAQADELAAAEQTESPEVAAARMAAKALDDVGGLIARVDQLETQLRRVDRQTLMLVGMVTLCMWSIKSLAGKVGVDAPAAPAS